MIRAPDYSAAEIAWREDPDEAHLGCWTSVDDRQIRQLERRIDCIEFANLPRSDRAKMIAILHFHDLVDSDWDAEAMHLTLKPRAGIKRMIQKAINASAGL